MRTKFSVGGMSCAACSARIERVVSNLSGIHRAQVNLLANTMIAEYDETRIETDDIILAVEKAGFTAEVFSKTGKNQAGRDEILRSFHKRLFWSFVFLIPLMVLSMQHMLGYHLPAVLEDPLFSGIAQLLLVLPIIFVNRSYYTKGFYLLFKASPNMDSLIAVGSGASLLYSLYALGKTAFSAGGGMHYYFESAAMILALITLGKYFETRSKHRAGNAIADLMRLVPDTVTVRQNGEEKKVAADTLMVGDIIIVRAGERIAADGIIISGNADIDESAVTGESLPVEKKDGDKVVSGTVPVSGYIEVEAQKTGEDTALSEIIRLVEEAASSKAPIARIADRISGIFTPVVMTIALVTLVIWLLLGAGFEMAMHYAVSVLVISCPCSLGLATPVAIMVGTGVGAKNGILLRNAQSLETAAKIDTIVLDKTGTVTTGKLSVTNILPLIDSGEFLNLIYSMESISQHPVAKAICDYAAQRQAKCEKSEQTKTLTGMGVMCVIGGNTYFSGNERLALEHGIDVTPCKDFAANAANGGETVVYFFSNTELFGAAALSDTLKPTSAQAVSDLQRLGIDIYMVTGDNQITADRIAKDVGIKNVVAGALPRDKEEKVSAFKKQGKTVAMVGDGINDALALTEADVGIAIGAGTDVAIDSADIVLMRSDLADVVSAISLSHRVMNNIKTNLFWAFFYNTVGIPIAAGVLSGFGIVLNPMLAAAAMALSSVCVVANALRLKIN